MIYVIMAGGYYDMFKGPKALQVINGEALIDRTIRLLKESGISKDNIYISSDYLPFKDKAKLLIHDNNYRVEAGKLHGYWLDAFYPHFPENTKVTYLFGDVYYSAYGIETIIKHPAAVNTLYGALIGKLKLWQEPLAYKVLDYKTFLKGIEKTKELQDAGLCNRTPLVWELYRVLNSIDVNTHILLYPSYINIKDGGMDVDYPHEAGKVEAYFETIDNNSSI